MKDINEEKTTLSLIIPMYNAELYIGRCLESIYNYHISNREIIIVDDMSTDNSIKIVEDYINKLPEIRIVENNKHLGAGACRNIGIKEAEGEYIQFVDADDEIGAVDWNYIIESLKQKKIELGIFGSKRNTNGNITESNILNEPYEKIVNGQDMFDLIMEKGEMKQPVWIYIIRRDYLCRTNLLFTEGIINEDTVFSLRLILFANTVQYFYGIYGYIHHKNTGSVTFYPPIDFCLAAWENMKEMIKIAENYGQEIPLSLSDYINKYYYQMVVNNCNKVQLNEIDRELLKKDRQAWYLFKAFYYTKRRIVSDEILRNIGRSVIIFGVGEKGKKAARELLEIDDLEIAGFAVSDEYWDDPQRKDYLYGFPVKRISEFIEKYRDSTVLITTVNYKQKELKDRIADIGFYKILMI